MSYDYLQKFYEKEKELRLFELEIDGVYYWQLLRFEFSRRIRVKAESFSSNSSKSYIEIIIHTVCAALKQRRLLNSNNKIDALLLRPCVTFDKVNSINVDHQYDYSEIFNNIECENIYALGSYYGYSDVAKYNMSIAEAKLIFWKIKRKLFEPLYRIQKCNLQIQEMLKYINEEYGIDISEHEAVLLIQFVVKHHKIYTKEWIKKFSEFEPKLIVLYPHYDLNMFAAISAAKNMTIPTLEIQHGLTNKYCPYYFLDTSVKNLCLPDYIAVFGDWWISEMRLPDSTSLVPVGSCYMEKALRTIRKEKVVRKRLLVLINPDSASMLIEFIIENIYDILNQGVEIAVKLHPRECENWEKLYPLLVRDDIEVVADPNVSVYYEISKSTHIIGINSTTLFEAQAFDDKIVLIYKSGNYYPMMAMVDVGVATLVSDKEALIRELSKSANNFKNAKELFWQSNANEHMARLVKSIINQ